MMYMTLILLSSGLTDNDGQQFHPSLAGGVVYR